MRILRRRHRRRLIVVEAPAGFGRTTLLAQAVEEGPARAGDSDLVWSAPDGLAEGLQAATAGDPDHDHAVIVDDAHLAPDAGVLADLVAELPTNLHLVASARQGALPGLARAIARGDAERIGAADLAFTAEERRELGLPADWSPRADLVAWPALAALVHAGADDLVVPYLRDEVLAGLDPRTVLALGCLTVAGGGDDELVDGIVALTGGGSEVRAQLTALPLAGASEGGAWPHPVWAAVTADVAHDELCRRSLALAVEDRLRHQAFEDAGALALAAGEGGALERVVRVALAPFPPRVRSEALRSWRSSGLLDATAALGLWVEGAVAAQAGEDERALARLEEARAAFEAAGDVDAESSTILHLGALARRTDDLGRLAVLVGHAQRLAGSGSPVAVSLAALGEAVAAALAGDPHRAVQALEEGPVASLEGDWAGQLHMVLGTNLTLVGRHEDAVRSLRRATGVGSPASRSTAEALLSSTLWTAGELQEGLDAAARAEAIAEEGGATASLAMARALRAMLCSLAGDEAAPGLRDRLAHLEHSDAEAHELDRLSRVVAAVQAGDLDEARRRLGVAPPPTVRPTRSKFWRAALEVALLPEARDVWLAVHDEQGYLQRAIAAGDAGAAHLSTGAVLGDEHRPFLPSRWWPSSASVVHLRLLGGAVAERSGVPVDASAWNRGRVRELALHLAVRRDAGRDAVATVLWPDLGLTAARRNLRVTLTHLLDVLDPDRRRGEGSDLVVDSNGRLHFAEVSTLRVDIRERRRHAEAVLAAASAGDTPTALAAARRLLTAGHGPVLGGAAVGEWFEPLRAADEALVARAGHAAGSLAVDVGDPDLARDLGALLVEVDPWSEQAHQLVVAAHLAAGEVDEARRAFDRLAKVLAELDLEPQPRTVELARRAGIGHALRASAS